MSARRLCCKLHIIRLRTHRRRDQDLFRLRAALHTRKQPPQAPSRSCDDPKRVLLLLSPRHHRTDLAFNHTQDGGHRARAPEEGAQGLAERQWPLRLLRADEFERRRLDEPAELGRRRAREEGDGLGGRHLQSADGVLRGAAASSGRVPPRRDASGGPRRRTTPASRRSASSCRRSSTRMSTPRARSASLY